MGDKTQLYMCEREIVGQFIKLWSMRACSVFIKLHSSHATSAIESLCQS